MNMISYIVHDGSTGEVLHVHAEPADLGTATGEILHLAGLTGREGLEVLRTDDELPEGAGFVVREGRLQATDAVTASGGAGGTTESPWGSADRQYVHLRR